MKNLLNDLKAFAIRGNVIDMAVGIIIGVAFGKIVSSLVNDVMMPPLGLFIGKMDFSHLVWTLQSPIDGSAAVNVRYGMFINTIIDFSIIAFSTFMIVRAMIKFKKNDESKEEKIDPAAKQVELLAEIRDLLKSSPGESQKTAVNDFQQYTQS